MQFMAVAPPSDNDNAGVDFCKLLASTDSKVGFKALSYTIELPDQQGESLVCDVIGDGTCGSHVACIGMNHLCLQHGSEPPFRSGKHLKEVSAELCRQFVCR